MSNYEIEREVMKIRQLKSMPFDLNKEDMDLKLCFRNLDGATIFTKFKEDVDNLVSEIKVSNASISPSHSIPLVAPTQLTQHDNQASLVHMWERFCFMMTFRVVLFESHRAVVTLC